MEEAKITSYFSEVIKLDPTKGLDNLNILRMTQQLLKEHPDDLDLMRRSEWRKYVVEVEEFISDGKGCWDKRTTRLDIIIAE
jgi:hypothetical protein